VFEGAIAILPLLVDVVWALRAYMVSGAFNVSPGCIMSYIDWLKQCLDVLFVRPREHY
jgi:hypothetical protein